MDLRLVALTLCCVGFAMAQLEDLTRKEGASGPQVVDAVVGLLRESCAFPNDRLLLRRFAFIETNDGQDPKTYRAGFDGGIWAVNQTIFMATQNDPNLQQYYNEIATRYGINWNSVRWADLRKPLYSGLAAELYSVQAFGNAVPVGVEKQAAWYQQAVHPNDRMAAYNFTKTAQRLDAACGSANLDLAFLFDSSSSMSPLDFDLALQFAADIVGTFTVGPDAVRVALLTFSTGFKTWFDFNANQNVASVQRAIGQVQYTPGATATSDALAYAANTLFKPSSGAGARAGSAKVAILVTDGKADRSADAIAQAKRLKDSGVTVFSIGVGTEIDMGELESLASEPSCTHVQVAKDYQDLETLRAEIQQLSCRAPVILTAGNYSFPCNTDNNFRIYINGTVTVTIKPNNGYVDLYASFLNPNPSAAFNEVSLRATNNQPGIIYVKDSSRPLYLSVVSRGADPVLCNNGNFDLIVQNKNAIDPTAQVKCFENGILRECTPLDILMAIYTVTRPASLGVPSPCRPNHPGFFKFPNSYDKFIYCDAQGNFYLVYCPAGTWYNDYGRTCAYGTPPPALTTLPTRRPTSPPTNPLTQVPGQYNPCTQAALDQGLRFFPYPSDVTKYIACTEWPGFGVVKDCDPYHRWEQQDLACIYIGIPATNPPDPGNYHPNQFLTSPMPIDFDCTPGLVDGDIFYHEYPPDRTKFIQCDQFGNAFIMPCKPQMVWNQARLNCIPNGLLTANYNPNPVG